ncbi:hypothetical protein [Novosphingobium resinovorum]|uniref:hypothetical protein n=1 Tax=Novosphingobium resinovorum TaxID=158500 RepID=UPI002ED545CA|nr:hypothetical protein [Novosphingobium resinovorum]
MLFIRILALLLGLLAICAGLFVAFQGTGVLKWPHDSIMVGQRAWAIRGVVLAMVGAIVVWLARRA